MIIVCIGVFYSFKEKPKEKKEQDVMYTSPSPKPSTINDDIDDVIFNTDHRPVVRPEHKLIDGIYVINTGRPLQGPEY